MEQDSQVQCIQILDQTGLAPQPILPASTYNHKKLVSFSFHWEAMNFWHLTYHNASINCPELPASTYDYHINSTFQSEIIKKNILGRIKASRNNVVLWGYFYDFFLTKILIKHINSKTFVLSSIANYMLIFRDSI